MTDTKVKVISLTAEEMKTLLDRECPSMSPASRSAIMQGAVLQLKTGEQYRIPDAPRDGKPTHTTTMAFETNLPKEDSGIWNIP